MRARKVPTQPALPGTFSTSPPIRHIRGGDRLRRRRVGKPHECNAYTYGHSPEMDSASAPASSRWPTLATWKDNRSMPGIAPASTRTATAKHLAVPKEAVVPDHMMEVIEAARDYAERRCSYDALISRVAAAPDAPRSGTDPRPASPTRLPSSSSPSTGVTHSLPMEARQAAPLQEESGSSDGTKARAPFPPAVKTERTVWPGRTGGHGGQEQRARAVASVGGDPTPTPHAVQLRGGSGSPPWMNSTQRALQRIRAL